MLRSFPADGLLAALKQPGGPGRETKAGQAKEGERGGVGDLGRTNRPDISIFSLSLLSSGPLLAPDYVINRI